jgi:hypothetical protein
MCARAFPALLFAALAAGCGDSPRAATEKRLRKADLARLRADAAVLYKDLHASATPDYFIIKEGNWPASFRALEPVEVGAYRDGFTLACTQGADLESGLYVTPAQMDAQPHSTERAHFERLADGIYWYSFKR